MNRTVVIPAALALLGGLAGSSRAQDAGAFVKEALGREIIGPRQALADTQDFTVSRVPGVPRADTAEAWTKLADQLREDTLSKVIFRGAAAGWRSFRGKVEWVETIPGGPGYHIKKLRFEVVPGLWIPALLYEPDVLAGKVPVVLNVNGHDAKGKAADYKQIRCINQAKRGMLALNLEWFGMGQLRTDGFQHGLINAIDLCGTSGIALHFLAMKRGLDILLDQEHADPARVAVTGLSGGGWQTIFFSPLDTRVTLTNPVAGYSSFVTRVFHFSDLGDSEQTPCDLATVVDYTHLTAMMAPRVTLLTFNARDNCCFASPHALPPLVEAVAPIFALYGVPGRFRAHVNHDPGDHNYLLDNRQALYQVMADHWSTLEQVYSPKEIPSDAEVKTAEALAVPLPEDNLDFHKLSLDLARSLPHDGELPENLDAARSWQERKRSQLRRIVRPFGGEAVATTAGTEEDGTLKAARWRVRVGGTWTVPAVELSRSGAEPRGTTLVLADEGRAAAGPVVAALLESGRRVVAVDPFYFGESKMAERDYLWALLVATVGERPLGVQVGQLTALARWSKDRFGGEPVEIVAVGPRTSLIALTTAALDPETIGGVELRKPLGSLKEVLESNRVYTSAPEQFCFGLLEAVDVKQLAALVAPRPVRIVEGGDRVTTELAEQARFAERLQRKP